MRPLQSYKETRLLILKSIIGIFKAENLCQKTNKVLLKCKVMTRKAKKMSRTIQNVKMTKRSNRLNEVIYGTLRIGIRYINLY